MMSHLIILGGGPAGAAAAIHARGQGLSVTLIDQSRKARRLPGETVAPGIEPLLRQLGVWEAVEASNFLRHTGIWRVSRNGDKHFTEYGRDTSGVWRGLQLSRLVFHEILRNRAVELGTHWHDSKPIKLQKHSHQEWTVETASGNLFRSNILIDASGRHAWLAKQLGLSERQGTDAGRVLYGWQPRQASELDVNPVFKEQQDGWDWSATVTQDQTAWVQFRSGEFARGVDMTSRIYEPCAGENWFLVGDAACLTTPASGNGILRAIMSGIFAVHLSTAIVSNQIPNCDCAAVYRNWMMQFWESSIHQTDSSHLLSPAG